MTIKQFSYDFNQYGNLQLNEQIFKSYLNKNKLLSWDTEQQIHKPI